MKSLTDFKVSEYCLVIDILGTTNKMANPNYFLNALNDLLNIVKLAYQGSADIGNPEDSVPFFQFGDTIVFAFDDPHELVSLGCRIFSDAFYNNKGILLQGCISNGGLFYINDLTDLKGIPVSLPTMHPQLVFGLSIVSAFAAMRGIVGPRLLINEEWGGITTNRTWRKYPFTNLFPSTRGNETSYRISDIEWWINIIDLDEFVDKLIAETKTEYQQRKNGLENNMETQEKRELQGFEARIKHLETFKRMIEKDNL